MKRPENMSPEMEAYCAYLERLNQEAREEIIKQRNSQYSFSEMLNDALIRERQRHAMTRATRNRVIKERDSLRGVEMRLRHNINSLHDRIALMQIDKERTRWFVRSLKAEIERLNCYAPEPHKYPQP